MFTQTTAAHFHNAQIARGSHISKHRQFDAQTGKHIPGRCRIGEQSGLRKLMRAARRGKIPTERMRVMLQTAQSVAAHLPDYMSAHARRAAGITRPEKSTARQRKRAAARVIRLSDVLRANPATPAPAPLAVSKPYGVKSNAARAAAKYGVERGALFEVAGGWAFNIPAVQA